MGYVPNQQMLEKAAEARGRWRDIIREAMTRVMPPTTPVGYVEEAVNCCGKTITTAWELHRENDVVKPAVDTR